MEYLLAHSDWLEERLDALNDEGIAYVLFDCPGQVHLTYVDS